MRSFFYGLAVIPVLVILVIAYMLMMDATRDFRDKWEARTSNRRYAYPDRALRRPFRRARYRIGLWFLKPYLARTGASLAVRSSHRLNSNIRRVPRPGAERTPKQAAAEKRRQSLSDRISGELLAYRNLANIDGLDAFGDRPALGRFTRDEEGWPKRFHILTPVPRPWSDGC